MPYILAILFGVVVTFFLQRKVEREERPLVWAAFFAHGAGVAALMWIHTTRGSDMNGYERHGIQIAGLLRDDVVRWAPEVVKAITHRETPLVTQQTTTGAMDALCALVFLLIGDSLGAACLVVATIVLVGRVLLYRVVVRHVSRQERKWAAIGCLLVPSVTFWTSGLVKEAWSVAGMGMVAYGLHAAFVRKKWFALAIAIVGAVPMVSVKPYIVVPLLVAIAAWLFSARGGKLRPSYILLGTIVAVGGIAIIGNIFPEYGLQQIGDSISRQRYYSAQAGGGSYADFDMEEDAGFQTRDTTMVGQVRFLPLAMVNAFFRPIVFEAHNGPQLAAALEATALALVIVSLIWRMKLRQIFHAVTTSPLLFANVVFVVLFGVSMGLAAQNLGTLSRYRVPMMSCYVTAILILRHRMRSVAPGARSVTFVTTTPAARPTPGHAADPARLARRARVVRPRMTPERRREILLALRRRP